MGEGCLLHSIITKSLIRAALLANKENELQKDDVCQSHAEINGRALIQTQARLSSGGSTSQSLVHANKVL